MVVAAVMALMPSDTRALAHSSNGEASTASIPNLHEDEDDSGSSSRVGQLNHVEPVSNLMVTLGGKGDSGFHAQSQDPGRSDNSLHISFSAYGERFEYTLSKTKTLADDALILIAGKDGERRLDAKHNTYGLDPQQSPDGSLVTVTLLRDGRIDAIVMRGGEIYQVQPAHTLPNDAIPSSKRKLLQTVSLARGGAGHVVYRYSDVQTRDENGKEAFLCGAQRPGDSDSASRLHLHPAGDGLFPPTPKIDPALAARDPEAHMRQLLSVKRWTDCITVNPTNARRNLRVGVAADVLFYNDMSSVYGLDEQGISDRIVSVFAAVSAIYQMQLNVALKIVSIYIMKDYGVATRNEQWNPVNDNDCPLPEPKLTKFRDWTNRPEPAGVWHLLTSCYRSGTIGLAHIASLGLVKYGTGWSSLTVKFVVTVAHELGHNFGAQHSWVHNVDDGMGGIMDYGTGKLPANDPDNPNEYAFHSANKAEMCNHLNKALNGTQTIYTSPVTDTRVNLVNVWSTNGNSCGDGVVDEDEECDAGGVESPCCTSQCKLTPGSQCVTNGECCENCRFKPASTICGGGSGYCAGGTCQVAACLHQGWKYCGVQNGCTQMCQTPQYFNNACFSMLQVPDTFATVQTGSVCDSSPESYKVCVIQDPQTERNAQCRSVAWSTGPWSDCIDGQLTREVVCRASDDKNTVVADVHCSGTKPETTKECFAWQTTEWSACSLKCWTDSPAETGSRVRTVACLSHTGLPTADSQCEGSRPADTQECQAESKCEAVEYRCRPASSTDDSDYDDCSKASTWDACESGCGKAVQQRTVVCRRGTSVVELSECVSLGPPPPSTQECTRTGGAICNTYEWRADAWSHPTCNICGAPDGSITRTKRCVRKSVQGLAETETDVSDESCPTEVPLELTGSCVNAPCLTYAYAYGNFGECSKSCGSGVRTRSVKCMEHPTGIEVDLSYCPSTPNVEEPCNTFPCDGVSDDIIGTDIPSHDKANEAGMPESVEPLTDMFLWAISPWSECSQVCDGSRTRTVECYRVSDPSTRYPSSSIECLSLPNPPPTTESCVNDSFCYYWSVGEFGSCSEPCISDNTSSLGVMTRTVECKSVLTGETVDDALCTFMKPATTASCNRFPCPRWVPERWGECSTKCGTGIRQRDVLCRDYAGNVVPDQQCSGDKSMYPTSIPCKLAECPYWVADNFGQCDANCGEGAAHRDLQCEVEEWSSNAGTGVFFKAFNRVAAESMCTNAIANSKPSDTESCSTPEVCDAYTWTTGSWSQCSKSCGGGTQTRTVSCVVTLTGITVNPDLCDGLPKPAASQSCNTHSCEGTWHHTINPAYSQCSVECGWGVLDTRPICMDSDQNVIPDSSCPASEKYILCYRNPDEVCAWGDHGRGRCITSLSTGDYAHLQLQGGYCACAQGWTGTSCSIPPEITQFYVSTTTAPSRGTVQLYWKYVGMENTTAVVYAVPYSQDHTVPTLQGTFVARVPAVYETYTVVLPTLAAKDYVLRMYFTADKFWDSPPIRVASPCTTKSCGLHGTCDPNSGKCICSSGYAGAHCQTNVCESLGCNEPYGTCKLSTLTCECNSGYSGKQCRVPPNCPSKITCLNGGYETSCTECECVNLWITSGSIANKGCDQCALNCNAGTPDLKCEKCLCPPGWYDNCKCPFIVARMLLGTSASAVQWDTNHIASMIKAELATLLGLPTTKVQVQASKTKKGNVQLVLRFGSAHCDASFEHDNTILSVAHSDTPKGVFAALDNSLDQQDAESLAEIAAKLAELFEDPYSDLYRGGASQLIVQSAGLGLENPNCNDSSCPHSIGGGGVEAGAGSDGGFPAIPVAAAIGGVFLLGIIIAFTLRCRKQGKLRSMENGVGSSSSIEMKDVRTASTPTSATTKPQRGYPGDQSVKPVPLPYAPGVSQGATKQAPYAPPPSMNVYATQPPSYPPPPYVPPAAGYPQGYPPPPQSAYAKAYAKGPM